MKNILLVTLLVLLFGCNKQETAPKWDSTKSFVVEGKLYSKSTSEPVMGRKIALSQASSKYSHSDPSTITDSAGYFKISYVPSGQTDGLNLYPVLDDYSCVFTDISFISNIPKGENVNLKKVYTSYY